MKTKTQFFQLLGLGLLVGISVLNCGPRDTPVLVTLSGLTSATDVEEIELLAEFDGRLRTMLHLRPQQNRALVYIPESETGSLLLTARVLDRSACAIQKAASSVWVTPVYTEPVRAEVELISLDQRLCQLAVDARDVETVLIKAEGELPAPVSCVATSSDEPEHPCLLELPVGTAVSLSSKALRPDLYLGWSGDCLRASDDCSFTLLHRSVVRARTGQKICGLTGRCEANEQTGFLREVWGFDKDDIWTVGGFEQGGSIAMHWNGSIWSRVAMPTERIVAGLWGSGPEDMWAVGEEGKPLHWDGLQWTTYQSPLGDKPPGLFNVWGLDASHIWAVGPQAVLFWNGAQWTVAWQQAPGDSESIGFDAIGGSSADDIWVGGNARRMMHWDGSAWSSLKQLTGRPPVENEEPDRESWIIGITCSSANDCWAAGHTGIVWHYDGKDWSLRPELTAPHFYRMHGTGPDEFWAVGRSGIRGHWNGQTKEWSVVSGDSATSLFSVWGRGQDVWTVGWTMRNWNGKEWTTYSPSF